MGVIFGISDLPVSTIGKTLQVGGGINIPQPEYMIVPDPKSGSKLERTPMADNFLYKKSKVNYSYPIIKMRNGFGKLMKHFSKVLH